jgi:diguanylate cyclase (GGDEF)-like protein
MVETAEDVDRRTSPPGSGRQDLCAQQVDVLYDQSLWTLPGGLAAALLIAVLLWPLAPRPALLVWLGLLAVLAAVRLGLSFLYRRDRRRRDHAAAWRRAYLVGTALSGAVWAAGAIYVAPGDSPLYLGAYVLWIGGLLAAGAAALSVVLSAYLAFALPTVLPVAAYLVVGRDPTRQTLGLMLLLFAGFMGLAAWRVNRALAGALRVRFENLELNARLEADLARHVQIETQLRQAKRRAESLARQLRQLSAEDGLTGIANRRHFDHVFQREWRRATRGRYPLSLILVDLDFFKDFNDRHGHQAGDECLREVAAVLRSYSRRPGDLAARYGGEEFTVVLPGIGLGDAREIAARILAEVEGLQILHGASRVGPHVTLSAGVASLVPDRNMSSEHLIELADAALYRAKGEGRNRVATAGDFFAEALGGG